jgi:hypothetical protein
MRKKFAAAAVMIFPLALAFTDRAQAQDVRGWDKPENAEFVVKDVQTKIRVGQVGTVVRDVHCDCDLLKKGRTQDGRSVFFLTPAFFAQFNAESVKTWDALPANVRQVLERSRNDMTITTSAVDGIRLHLETEHGISAKIVEQAAKRCKTEHFEP